MTETTNYKLKKPGYEDYVDIGALNANADVIDAELHKLNAGKSDTVKPSAAGNLAALAADGKLQDSGRKPGEKNGVATLDENGHIPGDQLPNSFLPLKGGTMSGPINMNGQRITGLPKPSSGSEPMRKDDGGSAATLALFGLGPDSVLDDVLALLSKATLANTIGGEPLRREVTLRSLPDKTKLYSDNADFNGSVYPLVETTGAIDYPSSGIMLLAVRTDGKTSGANYGYWDSKYVSKYDGSGADNNALDVITHLPEALVNILREATISVDGEAIKRKAFLPSGTELGYSQNGMLVEGKNVLQNHASDWYSLEAWTRSTHQNNKSQAFIIQEEPTGTRYKDANGNFVYLLAVDANAKVYLDDDGKYYIEQKYTETKRAFTTVTGEKFADAVQIATGSYVGTNKYGESNPNSLTFEFTPKFVLIFWAENGSPNNAMAFLSADGGCSYNPAGSNGQYYYASIITVNITGNTITWYASSLQIQMNGSVKYQYFAIG